MIISAAIAIEIGETRWAAPTLAISSTRRISSDAYATDESASELNTGRASHFGSSVCSRCALETARPTRTRFTMPIEPGGGGAGVVGASGMLRMLRVRRLRDGSVAEVEGNARDDHLGLEQEEALDVEGGLVVQEVLPPVR